MANIASALKRIRASEKKRKQHRYQHKTTKTFVKRVLKATEKDDKLIEAFNRVSGLLDKLAKRRIIHPNKSARKKSQMARHIHQLKG